LKAFFDHNLSPYIARSIHILVSPSSDSATAKCDKFNPKTSDVDWLKELGREGGWTIFSADQKILKNPIERRAYFDANLTGFFLKPAVARLPELQKAATILWHWETISRLTSLQERGAYWLPINKTAKYSAIRL